MARLGIAEDAAAIFSVEYHGNNLSVLTSNQTTSGRHLRSQIGRKDTDELLFFRVKEGSGSLGHHARRPSFSPPATNKLARILNCLNCSTSLTPAVSHENSRLRRRR
jgi:hypothetical protein